jgi:hypothetical protein
MRYKNIRCPLPAYDNLIRKKNQMEETAKKLTNINIHIPLTEVITRVSEPEIYLAHKDLLKMARKKRGLFFK